MSMVCTRRVTASKPRPTVLPGFSQKSSRYAIKAVQTWMRAFFKVP